MRKKETKKRKAKKYKANKFSLKKHLKSISPFSIKVKKDHLFFTSKQKFLFSGGLILLTVLFFVWHRATTLAESATLYPTSCLGGWLNPHNAENNPDVTDPDGLSEYNAGNSAILSENASADIFCGSFKNSVPENSSPKSVTLVLSWNVATPAVTPVNPAPAGMDINNDDSSSTASSTDMDSSGDSAPASTTDDTPPTATDTTPVSFLNLFTPAYADEISTTTDDASTSAVIDQSSDASDTLDISTTTDTEIDATSATAADVAPNVVTDLATDTSTSTDVSTTTNDGDVGVTQQDTDLSTGTTTGTSSDTRGISTSTDTDSDNPFLEIDYTLDGTNWIKLADVDEYHLHYNNSFDITLPDSVTWDDVSNMQVRISAIPRIDPTPTVYLDGMALEVTYNKPDIKDVISPSGLYFSNIHAPSPSLGVQIRDDSANEQELVISDLQAPFGNIVIYDASSSAIVLNSYIGDDKYVVQPSYFGLGSYVILRTQDPNQCAGLTLSDCRSNADYIGEADFDVTGTDFMSGGDIPESDQISDDASSSTSTPISSTY